MQRKALRCHRMHVDDSAAHCAYDLYACGSCSYPRPASDTRVKCPRQMLTPNALVRHSRQELELMVRARVHTPVSR